MELKLAGKIFLITNNKLMYIYSAHKLHIYLLQQLDIRKKYTDL